MLFAALEGPLFHGSALVFRRLFRLCASLSREPIQNSGSFKVWTNLRGRTGCRRTNLRANKKVRSLMRGSPKLLTGDVGENC
jgi:hypothetical protein